MAVLSLSAAMAQIKANPEKSYVYVLSRPDGTPFYVGVGTSDRILNHEREARRGLKSHKAAIIRKIISSGDSVWYSISGWFEIWGDAAKEERRLIAEIGRFDLGRGPLANRTDGGDGIVGLIRTKEHCRRLSVSKTGKTHSEETKAKIRLLRTGTKRTTESIEKQKQYLRGRPVSPETRAKIRASNKAVAALRPKMPPKPRRPKPRKPIELNLRYRPRSEEVKAKISAAQRGIPKPPERVALHAQKMRELFAKHRENGGLNLPHHKNSTPDGRAKFLRPIEIDGTAFAGLQIAADSLGIGKSTLLRRIASGYYAAKRLA